MKVVPIKLLVGNVDTLIEGQYPVKLIRGTTSYSFRVYIRGRYRHQQVCLLNAGHNTFPSGLVPVVRAALMETGHPFQIVKTQGKPPKTSPVPMKLGDMVLRDYQLNCAKRCVSRRRGIVQAPTASGKTLIAAAVIRSFNIPTVYLVPTSTLLSQTYESLSQLFPSVGIVGEGKRDWQRITICMIQTLHSLVKQGDTERFGGYRALIVDECHRVASRSKKVTWFEVTRQFHNAVVRIGFSATVDLEGEGLLLQGATGPHIAKIPVGKLQALGHIATSRCWFVKFHHNPESYDNIGQGAQRSKRETYNAMYERCITQNHSRNLVVVDMMMKQGLKGKLVLVFVDRIEQGLSLSNWLGQRRENLDWIFLSGDNEKEFIKEQTDRARTHDLDILIVTRKLFGEGVDIPAVDVIINAAAGKSAKVFVQMLGRGFRTSPGKDGLEYFDVQDIGPRTLARHAQDRMNHCKELGQQVEVIQK